MKEIETTKLTGTSVTLSNTLFPLLFSAKDQEDEEDPLVTVFAPLSFW